LLVGDARANTERVPRHVDRDVLRVDARHRHVDSPAVVGRRHLKRLRRAGTRASWQVVPELVEEAIHFLLEIKDIFECVPTGPNNHVNLLHSMIYNMPFIASSIMSVLLADFYFDGYAIGFCCLLSQSSRWVSG